MILFIFRGRQTTTSSKDIILLYRESCDDNGDDDNCDDEDCDDDNCDDENCNNDNCEDEDCDDGRTDSATKERNGDREGEDTERACV